MERGYWELADYVRMMTGYCHDKAWSAQHFADAWVRDYFGGSWSAAYAHMVRI